MYQDIIIKSSNPQPNVFVVPTPRLENGKGILCKIFTKSNLEIITNEIMYQTGEVKTVLLLI